MDVSSMSGKVAVVGVGHPPVGRKKSSPSMGEGWEGVMVPPAEAKT
jgi:hypothetical protein